MPIKFRCNYCRQFLGISRAQAGGIVDCPTCGRTIRVPQLDGSLQPVPEPELNLQDAHLARALDELARLGSGDSQPPSNPALPVGDDDAENELPQPIPEPIPIEVPIAPTPIAVNRPPIEEMEQTLEDQPPHQAAHPYQSLDVLAELACLPPVESPASAEPVEPRRPAFASPPVRTSVSQTVLLVALAFIAGMLFERFVKVLESLKRPAAAPPAVEAPTNPRPDEAGKLTGRITYKSADGASQPDRGARILVFPPQREGESKLSIVGFRPADGDVDAKVATASLQALGGAMTSADDAGKFQLQVAAGNYQILVISHFQARDDSEPIDPALRKLLAQYFDKPDDLLGQLKFDFGPLRVKGTGDVRDSSF